MTVAKRIALSATVTTSEGPAVVGASAYVDADERAVESGAVEPGALEVNSPAWELPGNTFTVEAPEELMPSQVFESQLAVFVDGVQVSPEKLPGPIWVERRRDRSIQAWGFDAWVDPETGKGPFGNPIDQLGSPLGKRKVDIYVYYRIFPSSRDFWWWKIISDGVADNYSSSGDRAEIVESHGGVDKMGRLSRSLISYVKPSGSRIRRDQAIREMFKEAGETSFSLPSMKRTNKPLQYVEVDPVSPAEELCELEGRQIQCGPDGSIRAPKLRGRGQAGPTYTFHASDIFSITISAPGDVITEVDVNGTEWVAPEVEGDESCALETTTTRTTTDSIYAPPRLRYTQQSDCTISDGGSNTRNPDLMQTRVVVRRESKRCGVLVSEVTEVWEWHAREEARYERDGTDPTIKACIANVKFLDGSSPTQNGSEPCHVESERWRMVRRTTTRHYYDLPGWQRNTSSSTIAPSGVSGSMPVNHLGGNVEGGSQTAYSAGSVLTGEAAFFGAYLGSETTEEAWYAPKAAVKQRTDSALNWEEEDYISGVKMLGSGDGIDTFLDREKFGVVRAEVVEVHSNWSRQKTREVKRSASYVARRGSEYLYGDGSTRADSEEEIRQTTVDETSLVSADEGLHRVVRVHSDEIDSGNNTVVTEEKSGALPAVEILPFIDETVLQAVDGSSVDGSVVAEAMKRHAGGDGENRSWTANVDAPNLELRHFPRREVISMPLLDSEDEAEDYAKAMISESAALPITIEIPLAAAVLDEVGSMILHYPPRGINGKRVEFRGVRREMRDRETMPTVTIDGRLYLD